MSLIKSHIRSAKDPASHHAAHMCGNELIQQSTFDEIHDMMQHPTLVVVYLECSEIVSNKLYVIYDMLDPMSCNTT